MNIILRGTREDHVVLIVMDTFLRELSDSIDMIWLRFSEDGTFVVFIKMNKITEMDKESIEYVEETLGIYLEDNDFDNDYEVYSEYKVEVLLPPYQDSYLPEKDKLIFAKRQD